MTDDQIHERYHELMWSGEQTREKHIRHQASLLVDKVEGGFKDDRDRIYRYTIMAATRKGTIRDVKVYIPMGMHGFALQMIIEEQIREGLA